MHTFSYRTSMVGTAIPTLQKRITYKFQTHCNLVVKYPPPHVIESCITSSSSSRERERERNYVSNRARAWQWRSCWSSSRNLRKFDKKFLLLSSSNFFYFRLSSSFFFREDENNKNKKKTSPTNLRNVTRRRRRRRSTKSVFHTYFCRRLRILTRICWFSSSLDFSKLSRSWRRSAAVSSLTSTGSVFPVAELKKTEVRKRS